LDDGTGEQLPSAAAAAPATINGNNNIGKDLQPESLKYYIAIKIGSAKGRTRVDIKM